MEQSSILRFLKPSRASQHPSRSENARSGHPYQHRSRPDVRSRHDNGSKHRGPNHRRNADLEKVADETKAVLPKILADIPEFDAFESSLNDLENTNRLSAADCPGFKNRAHIRVLDMDSFDAAIQLDPDHNVHKHLSSASSQENELDKAPEQDENLSLNKSSTTDLAPKQGPGHSVLVLNLASERSPGGGWQKGALAQEECLCYRSSLYLSLDKSFYPIPSLSAIYTPNVLIVRSSMANGHSLLPTAQLHSPSTLPAVSVVSVAALRKPSLSDDVDDSNNKTFKHPGARATTKRKIRLVLRLAAQNKHTKLVLGALGCGVFANPPHEVANCFAEVFDEPEFQGGWWEEVVFAVLDNVKSGSGEGGKDGKGNFGVFYRVLDGKEV